MEQQKMTILYCRLSKKIRAVIKAKGNSGKRLENPDTLIV